MYIAGTSVNTWRESFSNLEVEHEKGRWIAFFRKCAIFFFRWIFKTILLYNTWVKVAKVTRSDLVVNVTSFGKISIMKVCFLIHKLVNFSLFFFPSHLFAHGFSILRSNFYSLLHICACICFCKFWKYIEILRVDFSSLNSVYDYFFE